MPGDKSAKHIQLVNELGGIPYHPNQIEFAVFLAINYIYFCCYFLESNGTKIRHKSNEGARQEIIC